MDTTKLKKILQAHTEWLLGNTKGTRADLLSANLQSADLRGADLEEPLEPGLAPQPVDQAGEGHAVGLEPLLRVVPARRHLALGGEVDDPVGLLFF